MPTVPGRSIRAIYRAVDDRIVPDTFVACLLVLSFDRPFLHNEYGVGGRQEAHGDHHHDGRREAVDSLPETQSRPPFGQARTQFSNKTRPPFGEKHALSSVTRPMHS